MNWFSGLGWRGALSLAGVCLIVCCLLGIEIERRVRRFKARRRRHRLDRLNRGGFFRKVTDRHYRAWR